MVAVLYLENPEKVNFIPIHYNLSIFIQRHPVILLILPECNSLVVILVLIFAVIIKNLFTIIMLSEKLSIFLA